MTIVRALLIGIASLVVLLVHCDLGIPLAFRAGALLLVCLPAAFAVLERHRQRMARAAVAHERTSERQRLIELLGG
ncbi:MAG TPA: hypothetical protein VED59_01630 [Acidimicrobiales bacterium]|nr:hypothetical protein [Acidimicrobiales bacterium]